jgi:hypothetical protein
MKVVASAGFTPAQGYISTRILVTFFIFTGTFFALPGLIGRPTHDRPAALRQADRISPKGDLRRRDDLACLLFFPKLISKLTLLGLLRHFHKNRAFSFLRFKMYGQEK